MVSYVCLTLSKYFQVYGTKLFLSQMICLGAAE